MKANLKAHVYAKMVERDGFLVSIRPSGGHTVIAKVGAHSSLVTYDVRYPSANTLYTYDEHVICNGKLLGITKYRAVRINAGCYTYINAVPYKTDLGDNNAK